MFYVCRPLKYRHSIPLWNKATHQINPPRLWKLRLRRQNAQDQLIKIGQGLVSPAIALWLVEISGSFRLRPSPIFPERSCFDADAVPITPQFTRRRPARTMTSPTNRDITPMTVHCIDLPVIGLQSAMHKMGPIWMIPRP